MSNVMVLPTPAVARALAERPPRRAAVGLASARPMYVYGDSTAFPGAVDFIATIRAVVGCGVSLMKSQHAIDCARGRVGEAQEHLHDLNEELGAMIEQVEGAIAGSGPRKPATRDVGLRMATMARTVVSTELRRAQASLDATLVRSDATIVEARKAAALAFGALVGKHELPGAAYGFRLFATGDHYGAEVVVSLSCGLRATYDADLPDEPRMARAAAREHAREGVMITLPREVGWVKKSVEPVTLRLDALTVLGASIEGAHGALLLGKSERSGIAHAFDLDMSSPAPRVKRRDEERVTTRWPRRSASRTRWA